MHNFPPRTGFLFTGLFATITAILLLEGLVPEVGFPLVFIYGVIYFLLAAFIAIICEAEEARKEIEKQQSDLQSADHLLQSYTLQAEELAVLED